MKSGTLAFLLLITILSSGSSSAQGEALLVRSSQGGRWTAASTWVGGRIPSPGDRVQIRPGHEVIFDAQIDVPIRSILIGGTLTFDPDRKTVLTVGLIKIQAGDDANEQGMDTHAGMRNDAESGSDRPALLVGTSMRPISSGQSAQIRLAMVEGLDPEICPAILCQGGRMEFHGAPVNPTWTKLAESSKPGDSTVKADQALHGWKIGDRVIITATNHQYAKDEDFTPRVLDAPQTEERTIVAVDGTRLTLDAPLVNPHQSMGIYRGEVALLSRNVVVESADPKGNRGHTMYHRGSFGSISYAEFRHLGKAGKLGKYSLHFHQAADTMRGASVVGASIWDSDNRWITIHGTNRLVVRDCVGYKSLGHGFFLEDGTEVDNILDGNLAVQALGTPPLPGQALAYDKNDGAGFWWANSRNAFVRNVAVECDGYGFRLDAPTLPDFNPVLPVRGQDDKTIQEDIRLAPFLRFDSNEAHSQRRYGVNFNGIQEKGPAPPKNPITVGPDSKHPLAIRGLLIWDSHWAFTPATPGLMAEGVHLAHSEYGFWKPNFVRSAYRNVKLYQCGKASSGLIGRLPDASLFPLPLEPVDDRPPVSVMTEVKPSGPGRVRVVGSSADDGQVVTVRVNGHEARPIVPDFSKWEVTVDVDETRPTSITAVAADSSGNIERTPHVLTVSGPSQAKTQPEVSTHRAH